jgi:type I restriction enzyme S subunit
MNLEMFLEQIKLLTEMPDGVQRLRELILQFAVQGKLVSQDQNDEPSFVLLQRIKSEKRVSKDRRILPVNTEDCPFELPESWEWVRLRDIVEFHIGRTPKTKVSEYWDENGIPWVSIADMQHYGTISTTKKSVSHKAAREVFRVEPVQVGTILMSFKLTIGKISILGIDAYHNEAIISIHPAFLELKDFLYRVLPQAAIGGETKGAIKGQTLNSESLTNLLIPLPPIQEQQRIVSKVDPLMALCDQLEARQQKKHEQRIRLNNAALDKLLTAPTPEEFAQNWQRICDNFNLLYDVPETVGQLRQGILQLAVQGRLVAQDEGDEPAAVLVEEIKDEKERLIKEKKIKNLKSSPSIRPEEIPHHNPKNWELIRLRDLGEICGGGTPSKNKIEYWDGEINWFSPKDMKNKHVNKSKLRISDKALEETHLRMIPVNSILMVARSGILKRYFPVCINDVKCTVNQDIKVLIPFIPGITQYLQLILKGHQQFILENLVKGGMTVQSLKYAEFEQQPFPLPPKKEQKRIVAKVDQLMALCDELEAGLVQAQTEGGKLMEAVVHHVLAE